MLKEPLRRRRAMLTRRSPASIRTKSSMVMAAELLETRWLLAASYIITDLGTLPGDFATNPADGPTAISAAESINELGQVAGNANVPSGAGRGFLYSNGIMQDIGLLPGGTGAVVAQVNDLGQVTGSADTYFGVEQAFLYSNGVMQNLGALGGYSSYAYGINDSGQVVGAAQIPGGSDHAFLYSNGVMHDLGALAEPWSAANAINNLGEVVGGTDTTANVHAFLYSNGTMHDLGFLPHGSYSLAVGINDIGQVVGYADVGTAYMFAFLYSNGVMQNLGTLPTGVDSFAVDINNAGQVVGYAQLANGSQRAFLYSGGKMVDLNSLIDPSAGWALMGAAGINDAGQIVGYGMNPAGQSHAFVLTPVSPPRVTNVQVTGTGWSTGFLDALQAAGNGNGSGYAIPVGGTGAQLTDLPWTNVNRIQLTFSGSVNIQQNSLTITGINVAQYQVASFSYDSATFTATWTLTQPIGADRVTLRLASTGAAAVTDASGKALDGEWTNGSTAYPSGNGSAGSDFVFAVNVLPGDIAQTGTVNGQSIALLASHWLQTGTVSGDSNGDNIVNAQDIAAIASHWLSHVPAGGGAGTVSAEVASLAVTPSEAVAAPASMQVAGTVPKDMVATTTASAWLPSGPARIDSAASFAALSATTTAYVGSLSTIGVSPRASDPFAPHDPPSAAVAGRSGDSSAMRKLPTHSVADSDKAGLAADSVHSPWLDEEALDALAVDRLSSS